MVNKNQCCISKPAVQTEGYPKETPLYIPKAATKKPFTTCLKNEKTQKGPFQFFFISTCCEGQNTLTLVTRNNGDGLYFLAPEDVG